MKSYLIPLAGICILLGVLGYRHSDGLLGATTTSQAYIVIETGNLPNLPKETLGWINSQKFKDDLIAKGIDLDRIDPNIKDKLGPEGKTPAELVPILAEVKKAGGPPRLVTKTKTGKLSTTLLPKAEADARKLLKVGG